MKITTGVDRLMELLAVKKKISVSKAAKIIGVPKDTILDWADILEDNELVVIKMGLLSPKLALWSHSKKSNKEKKEDNNMGNSEMEGKTASLDQDVSGDKNNNLAELQSSDKKKLLKTVSGGGAKRSLRNKKIESKRKTARKILNVTKRDKRGKRKPKKK